MGRKIRKKKLAFVIDSITLGGVTSSLSSLLMSLDYERYDVDVYTETISYPDIIKQFPEGVTVSEIVIDKAYEKSFFPALMTSLKAFNLYGFFFRLIASFYAKKYGTDRWFMLRPYYKRVRKKYDVAIGFRHGTPYGYALECLNADKYFLWYHHGDYDPQDCAMSIPVNIKKCDKIITVSSGISKMLSEALDCEKKIEVIHNIIKAKPIREKGAEPCPELESDNRIKIVTVGRASIEKGVLLAIEACSHLIKRGYDISWYYVGYYNLLEQEREQMNSFEVDTNRFIFTNNKVNPFPYVRCADVYVQPSLIEAYGMSITEALVLQKPVVTTATHGAFEIIKNGTDGLIVETNAKALADGIERMITDDAYRERILTNVLESDYDNTQKVLKQLDKLIG